MICAEDLEQVRIGQLRPVPDASYVLLNGHKVDLAWTACHLGGKRPWFLCPDCKRRCGVLYPNACRKCVGVYYAVEHETQFYRAIRRATKHRASFGQTSGGLASPFPPKPKWMRWETYEMALSRSKELEQGVIQAFN